MPVYVEANDAAPEVQFYPKIRKVYKTDFIAVLVSCSQWK